METAHRGGMTHRHQWAASSDAPGSSPGEPATHIEIIGLCH